MRILLGFVIPLLVAGCILTPGSDEPAAPQEPAHEASGAPAPKEPTLGVEPVDETSEALTTGVPRWRLFLSGPDLHPGDGKMVYYDQPRASDWHGGVIAVRAGDEGKPERWVHLYLEMQRRYGDGYFLSLIAQHGLTLLDLVVIDGLLVEARNKGVEPPLVATLGEPALGGKPRRGLEEPSGPPPLPDWGAPGGDHTGPGGTGSRGSGPRGPSPYPNGNLPGQGGSPGPNSGVTPSGPGPRRTDFCDGMPCAWGDTSGIEWQPVPVTEKWTAKLGRFFNTYREGVRAKLRRDVFHDGKNPECMSTCNHLANAGAASLWGGLMAICYAATDGACGVGLAAVGAGSADLLLTSEYVKEMTDVCTQKVCISK